MGPLGFLKAWPMGNILEPGGPQSSAKKYLFYENQVPRGFADLDSLDVDGQCRCS
jgi:hypothetical protein